MLIIDYGIMVRPITSRNPQAYAILEWVNHTIGNILRTFKVQNMVLDDENSSDGIFASTILFLRTTVHATTQYTPTQLLFGRNSRKIRRHDIDRETIRK